MRQAELAAYDAFQEQQELEPHWLQVNIPEDAKIKDKLVDGRFKGLMPASIPRERLMGLNGLWVQPIEQFDVGGSDVIFDPIEFANALVEDHRELEGKWWEGYRHGLMGLPHGPLSELAAHIHLPRAWLYELGKEAAQAE
jgi:hypothetical protein